MERIRRWERRVLRSVDVDGTFRLSSSQKTYELIDFKKVDVFLLVRPMSTIVLLETAWFWAKIRVQVCFALRV